MKILVQLLFVIAVLHYSFAPPVTQKKDGGKDDDDNKNNLDQYMEYHRYLKEVVAALESDGEFREKLEKADESDIKTGKIADQLDFVHHNVRTQLDEIKRREMERLRHLATREYELTNDIDSDILKVSSSAHLDHENPHTFEIEDLKRLIKKTTADLAEVDRKRQDEFKEYEMEKEFEKHQKVEAMSESEKKEFEEQQKREEKVHKEHPKVHHPGSKQQLEEVWEEQDHMKDQEFNPKVFFMTHDLDGNGMLDADEVKALFVKELDKVYKADVNTTDLRERMEEMERMREHVFSESDLNKDGLIDYNEFLLQTKRNDFEQDPGWKGIDENQVYTKDEYHDFEKRRLEEIKYLQERGLLDAHGNPTHDAYQQQVYQQLPQQYRSPYYQEHPNEIPHQYLQPLPIHPQQAYQQGHPQQMPPQGQGPQYGQMPQGQVPQYGQMPQHGIPPAQYQQGQLPPQAVYQQGHAPQHGQISQPGQMNYQGQPPPQGQQPQGQVPQQGQMNYQAQAPPQVQQPLGQQPQGQMNYQGQAPPQGQQPQGQMNYQGQAPPQGQQPQGQMNYQGQPPPQGQLPQGQVPQVPQAQVPPNQGNQAPNGAQGQNSQPQYAAPNVQQPAVQH